MDNGWDRQQQEGRGLVINNKKKNMSNKFLEIYRANYKDFTMGFDGDIMGYNEIWDVQLMDDAALMFDVVGA